jgi:hypothetical protein
MLIKKVKVGQAKNKKLKGQKLTRVYYKGKNRIIVKHRGLNQAIEVLKFIINHF